LAVGLPRRRLLFAGLATAAFVLTILGGTLWRPHLNLSGHVGEELAYEGYRELERGHNEKAVDLYLRALAIDDGQADWWHNLGVAYSRLERDEEAADAFEHAFHLQPSVARHRKGLASGKARLAYRRQIEGDHEAA